jgi:chromosome segregation ATPase
MNRIKTGLLYKTRREYDEMIRRFENEMQNSSTYSRAEEARVLGEIRNLKSGIVQLEKYEKMKREHDDTHRTIEHKKGQKEDNWQQMRNLKTKLSQLNEQIKELQTNYEKYETSTFLSLIYFLKF